MKQLLTHVHRNAATDRAPTVTRVAAILLSALLVLPAAVPTVAALSTRDGAVMENPTTPEADEVSISIPTALSGKQGVRTPASPESIAVEITESLLHGDSPDASPDTTDHLDAPIHTPTDTPVLQDPRPDEDAPTAEDMLDPSLPLTQELIALRVERSLDLNARAGTKIYYPWPSGAMAVDLYKDGRQILKGQVADIGGTVYVPVQRFADLFGSFKTTYTQATEEVVITGTNQIGRASCRERVCLSV